MPSVEGGAFVQCRILFTSRRPVVNIFGVLQYRYS